MIEEYFNKIILGDSLGIFQEIPDNSVDVTFADPPFNLKKKYNSYRDRLDFKEYLEWCKKWIHEMVLNSNKSDSVAPGRHPYRFRL